MGRKEVGLLFPPFNQNKDAESLRIVYYMGKRNSCSFPTFIVGSRVGEVTSLLHTEKIEMVILPFLSNHRSSRFLRRFFFSFL